MKAFKALAQCGLVHFVCLLKPLPSARVEKQLCKYFFLFKRFRLDTDRSVASGLEVCGERFFLLTHDEDFLMECNIYLHVSYSTRLWASYRHGTVKSTMCRSAIAVFRVTHGSHS